MPAPRARPEAGLSDADRGERRDRILLHGEHERRRRLSRPMPARSLKTRMTEAHAGGGDELILRRCRRDRPGRARTARRRQSRDCGCAAPPSAGPAADSAALTAISRRDRIAQDRAPARRRRTASPAEGDEGPRDRLDQSARGEQPARAALALLRFGQHWPRDAGGARHRRRRHAVEPGDAHDLLDEVGGTVNVGTPGGRRCLRTVCPCHRSRSPAPRASP